VVVREGIRVALDLGFIAVAGERTGRRGVRQEARLGLRQHFLRRLPVRLCGGKRRIVLHRIAVDLQEILATRGGGEERAKRRGEGESGKGSSHGEVSSWFVGGRAWRLVNSVSSWSRSPRPTLRRRRAGCAPR